MPATTKPQGAMHPHTNTYGLHNSQHQNLYNTLKALKLSYANNRLIRCTVTYAVTRLHHQTPKNSLEQRFLLNCSLSCTYQVPATTRKSIKSQLGISLQEGNDIPSTSPALCTQCTQKREKTHTHKQHSRRFMKFLRVQCISYSLSAAARIVTVLKQFSTPQFNAARCFLFALQSIIAVLKL